MSHLRLIVITAGLVVGGLLGFTITYASDQVPKSGGSLNIMLCEDMPQGFAIHETSTISTVFPASACFNNLVFFDPLKPIESTDTIIGELASRQGSLFAGAP